ncbi:uncharacterized protein LOC134830585 [Culicoides brevitarsis]|uniref:uncharacterized protein LOC134830585 n=1 Tax=Culicoides brevitarsis TaxID=469753 RepID=UPI00307BC14A
MERINYIKPNLTPKLTNGPSNTGTILVRLGESVNQTPPTAQPKVYRKIELCSKNNASNNCDINKNLQNGDISKQLQRRDSCSSSSSNQQPEKSMIMVRKTYKEIEAKSPVMAKKVYKKRIFETTPSEKKETLPYENREEFYKYLGIDTKPPEKRVCRPEITNLDIFKRRSLRVRYLNIQNKVQEQVHGKFEVKEEYSAVKESPERRIKTPSNKSPVTVSEPRPHDVKVLRSYLKPKEKKTANLAKVQPETEKRQSVVLLKPIKKIIKVDHHHNHAPVKYLMRSKINLSESRLRSGLQKKGLLRPARYLSYFKNKRQLLRQQQQRTTSKDKIAKKIDKKPSESDESTEKKLAVKPVEVKEETTPIPIELPKSPVSQVPDSTVNFQTPTSSSHSSTIPTHHVSTIDTVTNSAHTLKNPLNNEDGSVLFAYALDSTLVIVQERSVSFWKYSPFKHLVGMDQTWELIGRTKRHDYDIEIDCCKSDRICFNDENPTYIELRATQAKDNENRQCPLSSVYVVVYSISGKQEFPGWTCGPVIKNFVQLDSVQSSTNDIHFIALPGTRYFIISWYQHLIQSKSSGLCKYSLTPDLRTLASIREFPHAKHNIYDLKCFEDSKLIGFGSTELSVWNHNTGDLIMSIDFKMPLGRNISMFEFKNQVINCMFLTQVISCPQSSYKSIKVLGINLSDDSWKILKTHELPLTFNETCSKIATADTANIAICSIDNGQTMLMMSKHDLHWIKLIQMGQRANSVDMCDVQLFFNGSQVVEIGENILIKSLDEFSLTM